MGEADDRSGPETGGVVPDAVREQLAGAGRTSDDGTGLTVVRDTATPSAVPAVPAPVPPGRSISGGWSVVTSRVRDLAGRLVGVVVAQPRRWLVVGGAVMAVVLVVTAVLVVSTGERDRSGERDFPGGDAGVPEVAKTRDSGDTAEATEAAAAGVAAKADELAGGDPLTVLRLRLVAFALDPARQRLALADLLLRTDGVRPTVAADTILPVAGPIGTAMLSPDGKTLLTTATDSTTRLWDLSDPAKVQSQGALPAGVSPYVVDYQADIVIGALPGPDQAAALWGANHLVSPRRLAELDNGPVDTVAISPDGLLAVTAAGANATVWSVGIRVSPRLVASFHSSEPITAAAFTPSGKTVLVGDATGHVSLWAVTESSQPSKLRTMSGHAGPVTRIAVSGDGTTVVSVDDRGGVAVWTTTARDANATELTVRSVGQGATGAPLPAGLVLVSTVDDPGSVWSWPGTEEPRQWLSLPFAHPAPLPSLLSSTGSRAVTVGRDGHLTIWDLAPIVAILADPSRRACELIGGQVTEQQWSDAVGAIAYRDVC